MPYISVNQHVNVMFTNFVVPGSADRFKGQFLDASRECRTFELRIKFPAKKRDHAKSLEMTDSAVPSFLCQLALALIGIKLQLKIWQGIIVFS